MANPSGRHPATKVDGWWVDGILWHLGKSFFGDITLRMFRGKIMGIKAKQVLTARDEKYITETTSVESWWLDKLQQAVASQGNAEIILTAQNGKVRSLKIEREYTRTDVETRRMKLCR